MKKNLIIFGTRPEAIKMAPLIWELKKHKEVFDTKVCVTGQHREMLDQVLDFFEIEPDFDLNLMKHGQTLHSLTADIISKLQGVLKEFKPDTVYVHGDTTTSMAASIAAFYSNAKICHIEAGLRTFNKSSPFPEEGNRQIVSTLAHYHFCPTMNAKKNLVSENIPEISIQVTGNTVVDALLYSVNKVESLETEEMNYLKGLIDPIKDIVLVTSHRRENFGKGIVKICNALKEISENKNIQIIYPVHLNPEVNNPVYQILDGKPNIKLIKPLSYPAFVWLMNRAKLIITDSGGIQEEAPSLGKPILVMRETTERPEAVEAGTVILVGTDTNKIVSETISLLTDSQRYNSMTRLHNPYGDGRASKRIVDFMLRASENVLYTPLKNQKV